MTTTAQIKSMHEEYCRITGLDLPFSMKHHFQWEVWAAHFTMADLALVVAYIRRRIKEKKRERESLKFSLLIGDYDRFAEDLSMARSESRIPPIAPHKAATLRSSGRLDVEPSRPSKTPAEIIKSEEFAQKWLSQLRDAVK